MILHQLDRTRVFHKAMNKFLRFSGCVAKEGKVSPGIERHPQRKVVTIYQMR